MTTKTELVPVLSISTNSTGAHRTLFPVGTKADALVHDYDPDGKPTFAEGVCVEMVTPSQADGVRRRGKMTFSDTHSFYEWLTQ